MSPNLIFKANCLCCGELSLVNIKGYCEKCNNSESFGHKQLKKIAYQFLKDLGCTNVQYEITIKNTHRRFKVDVYGVKDNSIYVVECGQNEFRRMLLLNEIIENLFILPYNNKVPIKYEIGGVYCSTCGNLINRMTSFSFEHSALPPKNIHKENASLLFEEILPPEKVLPADKPMFIKGFNRSESEPKTEAKVDDEIKIIKYNDKEYMPIELVAKNLKFSIGTILKWVKEDRIITTIINNRFMFTEESIQSFIDSCPKNY
jgi:hypothetical protein